MGAPVVITKEELTQLGDVVEVVDTWATLIEEVTTPTMIILVVVHTEGAAVTTTQEAHTEVDMIIREAHIEVVEEDMIIQGVLTEVEEVTTIVIKNQAWKRHRLIDLEMLFVEA